MTTTINFLRRALIKTVAGVLVAAPLAASVHASSLSSELLVYSSQPDRDLKGTIDAFNQHYPNVKVDVFRSGTTEVINRLRTEIAAGAPRPDVLLIADAVSMEALKKDGQLMPITDLKTEGISSDFFDADHTYVGTKLISTGIVVNKQAKLTPTSWKDLLKPEFKNQVVMPSPLYSGAAAITMGAWSKEQGLGWEFIEGLKANQAIAVRGNGAVLQQVANGEKMIGVLVDFMALNAKAKGSPVDFVVPAEGLTYVTEPVAILKAAKNVDAAKAFVNFLISKDGQAFSTTLGYIPLRDGVKLPEGYPAPDQLQFMKFDPSAILDSAEDDKKRFSTVFGG